jgi:hypothetical protein
MKIDKWDYEQCESWKFVSRVKCLEGGKVSIVSFGIEFWPVFGHIFLVNSENFHNQCQQKQNKLKYNPDVAGKNK